MATAPRPAAGSNVKDAGPKKADPAWRSLFDGQSMGQWKSTNFGGEGEVAVKNGCLELESGSPLTGITWTGDNSPSGQYELELEAQRLDGIDFFAGVTFPVRDSWCSFIVGGWAGAVVGISSIDGKDASENETTRYTVLKNKQWYTIRIRVTDDRIQCWIDQQQYVDVDTRGKKLSTRVEVSLSRPLGISAYECRAAYRNIRWRPLPKRTAADAAAPGESPPGGGEP